MAWNRNDNGAGKSKRHFCSSECQFRVTVCPQGAEKWGGRARGHYPSILGVTVGPRSVRGQGLEEQPQVFCFQKPLILLALWAAMNLFSIRTH